MVYFVFILVFNQLLLMLVEALGEETEQDEEPSTYMDGSSVS